jgi:hypothetical protein
VNGRGIIKHSFCTSDGNTVLFRVACCFGEVELEVHKLYAYMHIKLMILAANCKWTIGSLDPGFEQVKKRVVTS